MRRGVRFFRRAPSSVGSTEERGVEAAEGNEGGAGAGVDGSVSRIPMSRRLVRGAAEGKGASCVPVVMKMRMDNG